MPIPALVLQILINGKVEGKCQIDINPNHGFSNLKPASC